MIRKLEIESFKCFEQLSLPLAPLTLLTGENSGGKSSLIQALVLLAESLRTREWGRRLSLNGPELALGTVADVLNHHSARHRLVLGLATAGHEVKWEFKAEDRRSMSIELERVSVGGQATPIDETSNVRWLHPVDPTSDVMPPIASALLHTSWITAERTGPREILPLQDESGHERVGHQGEWAASLLYWKEELRIDPALCIPGFPPTLFHQTRARMQEIFPGCDLRITRMEGVNALSLRFRLSSRTDFHRPQNVGFGLSQLFPIIVALLAAEHDSILLIENPEVHLHPRAQQGIGELLALFAAAGRQIIVESHSDHVLNGIRLAVKKGVIRPDAVGVHFFGNVGADERGHAPISPRLDIDGRLDAWPDGFFDQFDQALAQLL